MTTHVRSHVVVFACPEEATVEILIIVVAVLIGLAALAIILGRR